ncbi:SPOSA6832_02122, partial [Sporobolomyces salmonicolor]
MSRYALSRKEEEGIVAQCRSDAIRQCEPVVAAFTTCAEGRTISVSWACRSQFKEMQKCMSPLMSEDRIDAAKRKWFQEAAQAKPPPSS